MPLLDAAKGLACAVIVGHHLSRYGPMPAGALSLAPDFLGWLASDGRLAVQIFLVIAGFLAAASLAPDGLLRIDRPLVRIFQRYGRLVMPYLAALTVCVLVAAAVRPWLDAELVPASPSIGQLLAHGLLLQDLLGYEALSTGVWYVAIDFQLFALALTLIGLPALLAPQADQL
ncbi:acyltransferase family protein, partial [Variovorax sp. CT11-76]